MGRGKQKANTAINKIESTIKSDVDLVKQAGKNYKSSRRSGGSVYDSAINFADETFEGLSKTKDGGKNYFKGGAKVGGMALGGLTLLDWLFD